MLKIEPNMICKIYWNDSFLHIFKPFWKSLKHTQTGWKVPT